MDAAIQAAETIDLTGVTVFQALRQVMLEIGPIAKDRRVKEGGGPKFNFRGIDDVLNAVHDSFARWGVMVVPSEWEQVESTIGQTKSGTTQLHVRGRHTFTVYGPNGDHITAVAPAEALDLSDKASSKAMSMAYKYAVIQMLSIPVQAGALDESDQSSVPYEHAAPSGPDKDEVLRRLSTAASLVGKTPEEVTAKWRENAGVTWEEFSAMPVERMFPVVRNIVAYAEKVAAQRAQEAPQDKANDAPIEGAGNPQEGA